MTLKISFTKCRVVFLMFLCVSILNIAPPSGEANPEYVISKNDL